MDSNSEDEFFDANEELSPNKSVDRRDISIKEQHPPIPLEISSVLPQPNVTNPDELIPVASSNEVTSSLERERDNIILKESEIAKLQNNDCGKTNCEKTSETLVTVSSNNIAQNENKLSGTELSPEHHVITKAGSTILTEPTISNDQTKPLTNTLEDAVEAQTSPVPVAPPRRKRKPKKDLKPMKTEAPSESVMDASSKVNIHLKEVNESNTKTTKSHNVHVIEENKESSTSELPSPFIQVGLSTTEMNRVLENGNSLEVVFNDDLITRKSGGPSNPGSPAPNQPNLVRCNSISGRPLTDAEILEQVGIKNLDTGETIPLSLAEEKLPECTNPLTLHILRLATEKNSEADLGEDEDGYLSDTSSIASRKTQDKRKILKKFIGKTVQKIRSVADEVKGQGRRAEESSSEDEEQHSDDGGFIKFKNHRAMKDKSMFRKIKLLQDLSGEHIGAVWTMKFSLCGKLLSTAGQDNVVRVWVLKESASNFEEMRLKYSRPTGRNSPTDSMTSSTSATSADDDLLVSELLLARGDDENDDGPFKKVPFVSYHGHTSDVLDLSWSKNYFLLSSSMDKTVRLWHISRQECLCCFQHIDFVTAICFHPRDDRYFLSGSLDGKIRLWNIPEKKVALWNEIDGSGTSLVTAANFCQNGKLAVVGTYDGRCIFYDTERLKYHTQVTVRSSRGKNSRGRKISGIEPMPGEDKVLITSNDSRIRLYDLKDHSLYCKFKGLQNESSQIRASFSHDGKMILCGSEDKFVYIWQTNHDILNVRKDRNEYYESFSAHDAVVTAAIFAPYPKVIIDNPSISTENQDSSSTPRPSCIETKPKPFEILVASDWQGGVKLFINR